MSDDPDIVDRLRDGNRVADARSRRDMREAADEIERLRGESPWRSVKDDPPPAHQPALWRWRDEDGDWQYEVAGSPRWCEEPPDEWMEIPE